MNSNRFILGKGPFIRKADYKENTSTMMRDLMIALIPLMIFGWVKNGLIPFIEDFHGVYGLLKPLLIYVIAIVVAFATEFDYYFFTGKYEWTKEYSLNTLKKVYYSYALVPPMILSLMLPIGAPLWTVAIASFFATFIGKLLFGGFGNNIFNPALVGYVIFGVCYGSLAKVLNEKEFFEIVSRATPLQYLAKNSYLFGEDLFAEFGGILNSFIGLTPGAMGETSALLCLLAFVWLSYRKVIDWRIPVIFVGGVFVLTLLATVFAGNIDIQYALFHVLNGGLMFGAVFMATEPVTGCKTPNGKVVFALGLAVITVLLRFSSNLPEGVGTSILTLNLFAPLIDRVCAKVRSAKNLKSTIITYTVIGLIIGLIAIYAVSQGVSGITGLMVITGGILC